MIYRGASGMFNNSQSADAFPLARSSAFDGIVPPHFYGVMAKTELGCQVLHQKGHFSEFAQFAKKHGLEQEDPDIILKLKSVIWAMVRTAILRFIATRGNRYPRSTNFRGTLGLLRADCRFWRKRR